MTIHYICRYCQQSLGTFHQQIPEYRLGFHFLTQEERQDIIQTNADEVLVKVICETCQEAAEAYPELAVNNVLIQ